MTVSVPLPYSSPTLGPLDGASGRPASPGRPTGERFGLRGKLGPDDRDASRALPDDCGLDIRSFTSDSSCTVTVRGEIDTLTAPILQECLLDVLGRPHVHGDVVVDLSQATFLGAAGLTALAIGQQMAKRADRVLAVRCGAAHLVIRVLEITERRKVLTIGE